jgi:RNA recognition motif-containing protein
LNKKEKKKAEIFLAYIVFENLEDATKSLELNGHEILGHHLRVNMAKKREAFSNKGTVFVGNLPFEALENDVYDFFKAAGDIQYVRKIPNKGIAYVRYVKSVNIPQVISRMNGQVFGGRPIRVSKCETKPKQEKKKLFKKNEKSGKIEKAKVKKTHKIKDSVLMSGRANNNPIVKKIRENQKGKFNKFSGDNQVSKKEMFRKGGKMDQKAKNVNREKTKKKTIFAGSKVDDLNMKSKKIKKNKVSKSIKEQKVIVKKLKSAATREKKG